MKYKHEIELMDIFDAPMEMRIRLREIRNEVGIRNNMYNNHIIQENEHSEWLEYLERDTTKKFFLVLQNGSLIGAAGLSSIDRRNSRADWAFYLTERVQGQGLGRQLEHIFLKYAFEQEALNKLNCEVIAWNEAVIGLHKRFGFVLEGVRRDHIKRDETFFDVHLLGLTKAEWEKRKNMDIENTDKKDADYYLGIIDKIQEIRGKNNKNWMDLLRLSFKLAPKEAAHIVSKIYEDDGEISALAKKLTE